MTVPLTLGFFKGQVGYMNSHGFDSAFVSSPGVLLDRFGEEQGVPVFGVEMPRRITPLRDLWAVLRLRRTIRRVRPDIVHSHTPKGGLLGMIAARLAGVPVRVYHMRGLPLVTARGLKRALLVAAERVTCALAHRVLCVSHSLREIAVTEGLVAADKIHVLGGGSSNGVDAVGRFDPDAHTPLARAALRESLEIPVKAPVIGFVGRLVKDKGVGELHEAWKRLREAFPRAHLLVVGPVEERDAVPAEVLGDFEADDRVHLSGLVMDTAPYYAIMDVVALPTYREGFPNVPLEAGALCLPVVATRVTGCTDAVREGETGRLVPPQDADALADALADYLSDPALRARHGAAARARVLTEFAQEIIWDGLCDTYHGLLSGPPIDGGAQHGDETGSASPGEPSGRYA